MGYDKATAYMLIWMSLVEEVIDIFIDRLIMIGPCNYMN
jgi:hypothetical protein